MTCSYVVHSNLAIRNDLIRNKLVLRNHFLWSICHLPYKDKKFLALRNNFRANKKFLIAKFDCTFDIGRFLELEKVGCNIHVLFESLFKRVNFFYPQVNSINQILMIYFKTGIGSRFKIGAFKDFCLNNKVIFS